MQAWPLEFNNSFFWEGGWAHNAGGLQLEIPDPDASFGLSCREAEGTGELLPEMGRIEASALGSPGESREVKNG